MPKLILQGTVTAPDSDLAAMLEALPEHTAATLAEPGCLAFRVTQRTEGPRVFEVYEEFTREDAFQAHQQRIPGTAWAEASREAKRDYRISMQE